MRPSKLLWIVASAIVFCVAASFGNSSCTGSMINPMDLCWDCMYPITIGNTTVMSSSLPDTPNPSNTLCSCGTFPNVSFGMTVGFWEPFALTDVTRTPFCMVNLGGVQLPIKAPWAVQGDETTAQPTDATAYFNVHVYRYPLFSWLKFFSGCSTAQPFSVQYMSELDPPWSDDKLAAILHPETASFANPAAQTACLASAISANTGLPNDSLYWCAGSQGAIYPLTGSVAYHQDGYSTGVLLTERAGFLMHQQGQWLTSDGTSALCGAYDSPILRPSQYRYQPLYPSNQSCEPFGRSTQDFASGLEQPNSLENYAYVIWQKVNCCNTFI